MGIIRKVECSVIMLAAASLLTTAASAEEMRNKTDYITGYVGYFDVIGTDNSSTQFGLEYRASPFQYNIRPVIGVNVTSDKAAYVYAGLNWEAELVRNELFLIPSFVAGAYKNGDGKDLGGAIQFRSGIEIAYQLPNSHRLGAAFNHISNASLYRKNPGAETAMITYSVPTGFFR